MAGRPRIDWSRPVSDDEAHHRAGGRRAINARRRFAAAQRRVQVVGLIAEHGFDWGTQAEIARRLGVHRSTIGRDVRRLFRPLEAEEEL
jgi:DNA-binding CsgD family transcriptional regulator